MGEGDKTRLVAWSRELRTVHERLRAALRATRDEDVEIHDLLLYCHGFCAALTGHHEGEDRQLFPALAAQHPELRDTIRRLEQDHSMIGYLLGGLQAAVDRSATADELRRHLQGVAAIMESHFRFEERTLLPALEDLDLDADPQTVLGPL
ncbi:hemerythrin domain-containing protein [Cryptosporangium phraense]|uniref:Hemerythrin domain-containing protein n=1 Tax=Cryptosporangium phraense TaxID=2593070 RepID=A0A545AP00_9ACTN|nr:hemerythrin domain-containing protein [Cryptosporangium phraense]TQS43013.1 hemerythrin domain-containing protein [Cryptosporangium phraense]